MEFLPLARIPDEILASILEWSSFNVITLWMAGDLSLNTRMARSCVVVRTSPGLRNRTLRKWPRALSNFRSLRILDVEVVRFSGDKIENIVAAIRLLSPLLTELRLNFEKAPQIPLEFSGSPPGALPATLKRHPERMMSLLNYWNIKETFPQLQRLAFLERNSGGNGQFLVPLVTSSFSIFPPDLQELQWSGKLSSNIDLSALPSGLTVLNFTKTDRNHLQPSDVERLPRTLTSLSGVLLPTIKAIGMLPPLLRAGTWLRSMLPVCPPTSVRSLLRRLPPATESIVHLLIVDSEVSRSGTLWAAILPHSLTELEILQRSLTTSEIKLLPRTLLRLIRVNLDFEEIMEQFAIQGLEEGRKIWPPKLISVSFADTPNPVSASALTVFPPTLVECTGLRTALNACLLSATDPPPSLTKLVSTHPICYEADLKMNALPKTLTWLQLHNISILPSSLKCLPPTLETLIIPSTSIQLEKMACLAADLPRSLETLQLGSIHRLVLCELPPRLVKLTVDQIIGFISESHASQLPPSLKSITVAVSKPRFKDGLSSASLKIFAMPAEK